MQVTNENEERPERGPTTGRQDGIDEKLIEELVTDSYLLVVVSHLSKAEQPVDPHTYGSGKKAAK